MLLPSQPVTLTVEQITALNDKLSAMRHDINNQLSLIVAAVELIRLKPSTTERMMATLVEQPPRVTVSLEKFSVEFERHLGISRH
jgi:nitrate reductase cytochrome c-type subunit